MRTPSLNPLLFLLAGATQPELIRQIQYLKVENRILRARLPKRLVVTPGERAKLLKHGKKVGPALRELMTIVTPRAFSNWVREKAGKPKGKSRKGRPRKPEVVRELVLRIARETDWGYTRILGELKKLGIHRVSRNTIKNILKEHGLEPGPDRGEGSWDDFVKRHASTLWACDFFTKKVWTARGLVDHFVLFFVHLGSRRVVVSGITDHPDAAWMAQQARNMSMVFSECPVKPRMVIRDGDKVFTGKFDGILESDGIEVKRITPYSPNLNAYAEAWVGTVKRECLDHFMVFGEGHLRHLVREYVDYYNSVRPHQALGNRPIGEGGSWERGDPEGRVVCQERLGGLLRHYYRRAA